MKSRDFAYWLQGVFELGNIKSFDEKQTEMIRKHLSLVFIHEIDPSCGNEAAQQILNEVHQGLNANLFFSPSHPPKPSGGDDANDGNDGITYRC